METYKRSFKNLSTEDFGLAVYNSGYQKCESGYSWGPAIRDHYLIHFVASGEGTFSFGDKTYFLTEGDLFAVFPHYLSYYRADNENPWEYYWVGFNGTQAKRLINLTPFDKTNPVLKNGGNAETKQENDKESINKLLKKLLLQIYMSRGNTPASEVCMSGYLHLFLAELIKIAGKTPAAEHINCEYIRKAMQFIQYNYAGVIGVADIASYVGISRSHLYRVFIEETGLPPSDFLQKHRISEACSLLRNSNLSVWEIANSVGFTDPLYFSRVFKKIKGISPSKYN